MGGEGEQLVCSPLVLAREIAPPPPPPCFPPSTQTTRNKTQNAKRRLGHKTQNAHHPTTRPLAEITNGRVAWFSIFSLAVTLGTGAFTVFHLRGFFKKRKLV